MQCLLKDLFADGISMRAKETDLDMCVQEGVEKISMKWMKELEEMTSSPDCAKPRERSLPREAYGCR